MSLSEHPEDLFDRLVTFELGATRRRRLGDHLCGCVACRFEVRLRADFAVELAADARSLPPMSALARRKDG